MTAMQEPKPWFLKPKRTPEQIAVEGRSPNRKNRKPRIINTKLDIKTARQIKIDRIANGLALGQTMEEASLNAGCGLSYGRQVDDPKAIEKFEAAKAEYRRKAEGIIDKSLEGVAKEVVKISLRGLEEKNRLQGGLSLLRGRGVLRDTPTVAIDQSDRRSITKIEIVEQRRDDSDKTKALS